jgi:adenylosuccinate synthase
MSKASELEERLGLANAENEALTKEVDNLKAKLERSITDYKSKLKKASKLREDERQVLFDDATAKARELEEKAQGIYNDLKSRDTSILGVTGAAAISAKVDVLRELFSDL